MIGVTSQVTRSMVAAPAAAATPPTRTVVVLDPVRQFPAGTGCEFDVTAHRIGRTVITDYSDGRETVDAHYIDYTIVNDANGKRFVTNFVHHEVGPVRRCSQRLPRPIQRRLDLPVPAGRCRPGRLDRGSLFAINVVGTVSYVVDGTTFAASDISIQGRYTDICAAIS